MPSIDPILIPIPPGLVATHVKPRWFSVTINNPDNATKSMTAFGETVKVNVDTEGVVTNVGEASSRTTALDFTITYDPTNPKHNTLMQALGDVVKEGYIALLTSQH